MATGNVQELYKGNQLSEMYAMHRPTYPAIVYERILAYHKESGHDEYNLAVDVGCGTGQSTLPLHEHFKEVVGVDTSETQLKLCPKDIPGVKFVKAAAEDLSMFASGSVDLVTAGTSVHWFDREKFLQEARRILKPYGILAIYTYTLEVITNNQEVYDYILQLLQTKFEEYLFMTTESKIMAKRFEGFDLPLMDDFRRYNDIPLEALWSLDKYLDYISSYHYLDLYHQNHGYGILQEMRHHISQLLASQGLAVENARFHLKWPTFMFLGRKLLK